MSHPKALGYFVLIELDEVKETTKSGIIVHNGADLEREQRGQHKGKIVSFGPCAFAGYNGIDADTAEDRAAQWGVKLGDTVEMGRYAGEMMEKEGVDRYMVVPDQKLMARLETE